MKIQNNTILQMCMEIFDEVQILTGPESADLPESWGDTIHQKMLHLEHLGLEKQIQPVQTSEARYALAALLDELVMMSQWKGRHAWVSDSLQMRLYGEHLAGVNFFERLARIRQGGEMNLAVLEVYYVCLQLGFQGKYAINQKEELKALQVDIKNQIDLYKGVMSPSLSYEPKDRIENLQETGRTVPVKWVLAGSAALVCVLYLGYGLGLHGLYKAHQPYIATAIQDVRSL